MILDQHGKPFNPSAFDEAIKTMLGEINLLNSKQMERLALEAATPSPFYENERLRQLRESCGVKNTQTIKFRRHIPYFSKDT